MITSIRACGDMSMLRCLSISRLYSQTLILKRKISSVYTFIGTVTLCQCHPHKLFSLLSQLNNSQFVDPCMFCSTFMGLHVDYGCYCNHEGLRLVIMFELYASCSESSSPTPHPHPPHKKRVNIVKQEDLILF